MYPSWSPERRRAQSAKRRKENPDLDREAKRLWRERNPDKQRASVKASRAKWREKNRPKVLARNALRASAKDSRTPVWLTADQRAAIRSFYEEAVRLTRRTGISHHVDHIVPLRGETVSGLHVPWNLQVIRAAENLRKSNRVLERGQLGYEIVAPLT